jgi:hypothetical protein
MNGWIDDDVSERGKTSVFMMVIPDIYTYIQLLAQQFERIHY